MKPKKLFLDLEGTVITDWSDPVLCNVSNVKEFFRFIQFDSVELFSYAVYDDKDLDVFNKTMRNWLETTFDVTFSKVHTVEAVLKEVKYYTKHNLDMHDFLAYWGKERGWVDFVRATQGEGEFWLLDDLVPDALLQYPNQTLRMVNVKNLT